MNIEEILDYRKTDREWFKERFALNSLEKIIDGLEADYKLTQARIDAMTTEITLNGYSFYISPATETKLEIDQSFADKLLEKLPKNINGKALLRLFGESKYVFHLEKDGIEIEKHQDLPVEIKDVLKGKGLSVQLGNNQSEKDKFIISSSEDWHYIVKSFERAGFYRDMNMAKRLDPLYTIDNVDEMLKSMGVNIPQDVQASMPTTISAGRFGVGIQEEDEDSWGIT